MHRRETETGSLDTAELKLSFDGNAHFRGQLDGLSAACLSPLFLVRIGPSLPATAGRNTCEDCVRSSHNCKADARQPVSGHAQAALAEFARKLRSPSMKASICGSVPMVMRHQFS